jgi:hypothetical protein
VFGSACVWQLGGGSCQTQRPHTNKFLAAKESLFLKRVRPLCRYDIKKSTDAATQSLSRTTLECQQKGKFFRRQKFAFLSQAT